MARIIVASTGYNINSDKRYLSLDSDISTLMIIDEQDILGSATEYTHGLGYLPTTMEFFNYGTQWFPVNSPIYDTSDNWQFLISPNISLDNNKVYFDNPDSLPSKIFISGNTADNSLGSGKNTAIGRLKVAKDGYDISQITDVRQFKFCSGLDTFKKDLQLSGQTTLTSATGAFAKVEITHGLGYIPIVTARLVSNDYDNVYDGAMLPINMAFGDFVPLSYYVTSTKIVFFTENVPITATINYNIYRNKLS